MEISSLTKLTAFVVAFAATVSILPLIKSIAHKFKIVSRIDFRRCERVPRPLLGGLGIFVGVLSANLACGEFVHLPWTLLISGFGMIGLGVIDDKYQISARFKVPTQLAAIFVWLALTPSSDLLLVRLGLPIVAAYGIHIFWTLGVTNAFNMIDGMDGLASGMGAVAFAFLSAFLPPELQVFSWTLCAGCLGHLLFNFPPASIFLGDSGSLFIGFCLSALGSRVEVNEMGWSSVLIPLLILAHPEIDAILAILRRVRARTPISQGDKDHIHHKLRKIGLGPRGSLAVAWFASIFCGLGAILLSLASAQSATVALALGLVILSMALLISSLYFIEHRLATQLSQIGAPLLHRQLKLTRHPVLPPYPYQAVVFDMLPYYKDLQERGIGDLYVFTDEFSSWVRSSFSNAQIVPAGSYSIIIIQPGRINREQVLTSFKAIISNHSLLKNDFGIPWGLHFYTDSTDVRAFEGKFGLHLLKKDGVESQQAA